MSSGWDTDVVHSDFLSIPGIDPAVEWALGEGRSYFFPSEQQQQWMPILIHMKESVSADEFASGELFVDGNLLDKWRSCVRVPRLHTGRHLFCTALVTRDFFELPAIMWNDVKLQANYRRFILRVTLGLPIDDDALPVMQSGEAKP